MKKSVIFFTAVILCVLSFGCHESNDDFPCEEALTGELSAKELDFKGKWKLSAITCDIPIDITDDSTDNPSTNLMAQYPSCYRDNIYIFSKDREYKFLQGSTLTDCDDRFENIGTWALSDGSLLTTVTFCSRESLDITLENSDTEFSNEFNQTLVDINGNKVYLNITKTFKKK
ncbi:DUF5004 domain-containing protein [Pseudotamlana carrageenivorans]|uniref:Lipocalin-like domain-containing protein n=1 Tax=Pseudotamlana carrageenivorans TaxID=2069432 RepID=A0A2I7SDR5_9FLAO|nr:DUF5004 domain-containing protein [Tamlana carrageenivorans]AUS04030.1 hypothetical protein C1A40_00370 [Tamlana carrageenivorans]